MAVEELGMDGKISIGRCVKKTVKNWTNDINKYLEHNNYDWRAVCQMENGYGVISAIPKDRYEAIEGLV